MENNSRICNVQGFDLFFKSLGLSFLQGPSPENDGLLANCLAFATLNGFIDEELFAQLQDYFDEGKHYQEYAQMFCLGATSLSLYESVWKTGLVMQEPRDEIRAIMRDMQLSLETDSNEPEDHAGAILYLFGEALTRLQDPVKTEQASSKPLTETLREIAKHLQWLRLLSSKMQQREGIFYKALTDSALKATNNVMSLI